MIRINLLQKRSGGGAVANTSGGGAAAMSFGDGGGGSDVQRRGIVNLVVLMLVPAGLYVLEGQRLPEIQAVLASKNSLYASLAAKNSQGNASVEEIKKYKEDQAHLQRQIDILEGLRRDRLREVRMMDSLQRAVPERVWFTKVDLNENALTISGYASSDLDLTVFLESISKSIFLKDVSLIRSSDFTSESGVLKKFDISANLEGGPGGDLPGMPKPPAGGKR